MVDEVHLDKYLPDLPNTSQIPPEYLPNTPTGFDWLPNGFRMAS